MTFREMLELYKNGTLPDEIKEQVEKEIEKHEAISDYLYDTDDTVIIDSFTDEDAEIGDKNDDMQFVKMINSAIRKAFLKAGVIVGTVVLFITLSVIFVLPGVVSEFYYDPGETVGEYEGIPTTRMSLDLSVYSEMFLPGKYRNIVIAEDIGYGEYNISIPQPVSYTGIHTTVAGKLERGRLTLYDPNLLRFPTGNAFVLPEGVEWYFSGMGAAGEPADAFAALESLDEDEIYTAYFSLEEITDYMTLYEEFGKMAEWCAVYDGRTMGNTIMGFCTRPGGYSMSWDREKYPYLCLLDGADIKSDISSDPAKMQTHFLSMMQYLNDHPEAMELFGSNGMKWDNAIEYVEENGIQIYGFVAETDKATIMDIASSENISYVYTVPVNR